MHRIVFKKKAHRLAGGGGGNSVPDLYGTYGIDTSLSDSRVPAAAAAARGVYAFGGSESARGSSRPVKIRRRRRHRGALSVESQRPRVRVDL